MVADRANQARHCSSRIRLCPLYVIFRSCGYQLRSLRVVRICDYMTLVDFNRGAEFKTELFKEFAASGNPLIDGLWQKPAQSAKERNAIGVALGEALLAGSPGDIRARVNRAIRALPLTWEVYRSLYERRTLRGNSHDWADAIVALLIRMPLASVVYRNGAYGNARLIIAVCLDELLRSSHVEGLDYDQPLETRMASLVDVVTWFARNRPSAKQDVGLAMEPMMTYLWNRKISAPPWPRTGRTGAA